MRTLVNLALLGVVLFAGVQSGGSIWRFYAFRDAVREEAMFPGDRTPEEIAERVLGRAEALDIPISPYDIVVQFEGNLTVISAVYEEEIPVVPRVYAYRHVYDASATRERRGPGVGDLPR